MNNADAIKGLKNLKGACGAKNKEYVNKGIEALKMQIPEKPYAESDGDADGYPVWDYYCPSCNECFDVYEPRHCWKCGKAIDWSEEE